MNSKDFREQGYRVIDWVADYLENIEKYPVKSQVLPGDTFSQIQEDPPIRPEPFDSLMSDLDEIILPGITHWQHPNFHAYFNGNSSFPSVLAEIITAGIGAQCMVWETSPAAAELEERMMQWFIKTMNLPSEWHGVIQDTASTATLAALLSAREQKTNFDVNNSGFQHNKLRVHCSTETHSSIEKGVKIAGFGRDNLVKVETNDQLAMDSSKLESRIQEDLENNLIPCCVIGTIGTTGTLAIDPIEEIGNIAQKYKLWFHIDAAYAGSGLILPEYYHLTQGFDKADSYVFNPHKWLFTNFDCSAYFVKSKETLLQTFEILPEYLKTKTRGKVNDYRDWGVPLGRRFRALKLWFVFRSFGLDGIQEKLRNHIALAHWLEEQINDHANFELLVPRVMNMVVFRYAKETFSEEELNIKNANLVQQLNDSGAIYLSHTKVRGKYALRLVTGQTTIEMRHVRKAWDLILETSQDI
ncbi:MAG: aspartate aminotransferase family protein [Cyclobacteriaceae bacterium]|nr:aspartate aminotransferase family protein [Cyclobacteriaceae bacterium HetDA_MAG_MS6]